MEKDKKQERLRRLRLRRNFEKAVGDYLAAFCEQFEIDPKDGWWVLDEIGTNLYCFGDINAIGLSDMIYCVENGVTYDEFMKWTDYNVDCLEFNLPNINLKSWHMGAPGIPKAYK